MQLLLDLAIERDAVSHQKDFFKRLDKRFTVHDIILLPYGLRMEHQSDLSVANMDLVYTNMILYYNHIRAYCYENGNNVISFNIKR